MTPDRTTYELIFRRCWEVRFISHLDILRAFSRTLRRTNLPLYFTEGFNPKPKISYLSAPLAVGHTSECERMRFQIVKDLPAGDVKRQLSGQLPPGLVPVSFRLVESGDNAEAAAPAEHLEYYVFIRKDDAGDTYDQLPALLPSNNPETAAFNIHELTADEIDAADIFISEPPGDLSVAEFVNENFSNKYSLLFPAGINYRRPEKLLDKLAVPDIDKMFFHRKREV
jgi:hypothetical protein